MVNERKEVLNLLKELWLDGDSPLHRIYSSWEELEENVDVKAEELPNTGKTKIRPCPNCGVKQAIRNPLEGIFPYQTCKSCHKSFYVNNDFTVRKLAEDERREIPKSWVKIVEDLDQKRLAVVFRIE
jgi:hypothetical protein